MYNNIKELRRRRGMTQEDLAKVLGINRVSVTRYENESRRIRGDMELKIAQALNVEPEELYNDTRRNPVVDDSYIIEVLMEKTRSGEVVWELVIKGNKETYVGRYQNSTFELIMQLEDRASLNIGNKKINSDVNPRVMCLVGMLYWKYGNIKSRVVEQMFAGV